MKKVVTILLLLLLTALITGCSDENKDMNYLELVDIPSLIELDIENVPKSLTPYITVKDEILVNRVSIDTSMVNFDSPGDYSIKILVDFNDGVTKKFNSVLRLSFNNNVGIPVILGVKNRLISPTEDTMDFLEGVAFSDNSKIIDSGVIGTVNLDVEGIYTLIYYAEDDDGNYVTTSSFIVVAKNLYFFDTFVSNLYKLSGQETKWLREYAILYAAIHAANEDNADYIGFFGHFLTIENFEAMLGRSLREDESNAITEVQKIFRKNDVLSYQSYYDVTFTNTEKEQFERAYEIYIDYASKTPITSVSSDFYIAHTAYSVLYSAQATTLNTYDQNALQLYSKLTKLSLDSMYFTIVNETRYELDERISDLDFISNYTHIINDINEEGLFVDKISFKQSYKQSDHLFIDIYLEYYKYKTLYKMSNHLLSLGYQEANPYLLEEAHAFLNSIMQEGVSSSSLLTQNIIDIIDIETILKRKLTDVEKPKISLFILAYDDFYETPFTFLYDLYDHYLSEQEKQYIKDTYTSFSVAPYNIDINNDTYIDVENKLGRTPTKYELEALDFVRLLNPYFNQNDFQSSDFIQYPIDSRLIVYVKKYQIDKDKLLEYLELRPSQWHIPVEVDRYLEYIDLFESYYGTLDLGELSSLKKLMRLFDHREIEPFVFERLIISNNIGVVEENYDIDFSSDEKKIINNYIAWVSNIIREEAEKEKQNPYYQYYFEDIYLEAYQTVITEAFPCVFILNDGYSYFNKYTFERVTGKEITSTLESAIERLKDMNYPKELEEIFLNHNINLNIINEENKGHFIAVYELYKKGALHDFQFQFKNYDIEKLTEKESNAFKYFYDIYLKDYNTTFRDEEVAKFRDAGLNTLIPSYLHVVDLVIDNGLRLEYQHSELTQLLTFITDEEDLHHIAQVQTLHLHYKYFGRYIKKLHIPGNHVPATEDAIYAIEFLLANDFLINSIPSYYLVLKDSIELDSASQNLSENDLQKVYNYIDALAYLSISNSAENFLNEIDEWSPDFKQAKKDLLLKLYTLGYTISDVKAQTLPTIELTDSEAFILSLLHYTISPSEYALFIYVGSEYLGYTRLNMTLDEVIQSYNVVYEVPLESFRGLLPPEISKIETKLMFELLYPKEDFENILETSYKKDLETLILDISNFNDHFLADTATLAELTSLQLRTQELLVIDNNRNSYQIEPNYYSLDLDFLSIPNFFELVYPIIYSIDYCQSNFAQIALSPVYPLQGYYQLPSGLNCYTNALLSPLFIDDTITMSNDYDKASMGFIIFYEPFGFYNYINPAELERKLGVVLSEKYLSILKKRDIASEYNILSEIILSNRLTLQDQQKVMNLTEFAHALHIDGLNMSDYINRQNLKDIYREYLTPEMEEILSKITLDDYYFGIHSIKETIEQR